jgi:hypothetical protein
MHRARNENRCCRIGGGDSRERPVLASTKRRKAGEHEKFFSCQKQRLRVHATCFRPTSTSRMTSAARRSSNVRVAKTPAAQSLLANLQSPLSRFSGALASLRASIVVPPISLRRTSAPRRVNTSLSGTLFFIMCWCIRDVVHLDSRVHAAIKPSHYIRRATWPRKLRRQRRRRAQ